MLLLSTASGIDSSSLLRLSSYILGFYIDLLCSDDESYCNVIHVCVLHVELNFVHFQVHLLCLVANGRHMIDQCNELLTQCLILSLTPQSISMLSSVELCWEKNLNHILRWYVIFLAL